MKLKSNNTNHQALPPLSANLSQSLKSGGVNDQISVNAWSAGKVSISFRRTIRVPDNDNENFLPPDLGAYPLYSVSSFQKTMPPEMVAKGGIFFPMYREYSLRKLKWMH